MAFTAIRTVQSCSELRGKLKAMKEKKTGGEEYKRDSDILSLTDTKLFRLSRFCFPNNNLWAPFPSLYMHPTTVVLVMRSESVTQAFHSRAVAEETDRDSLPLALSSKEFPVEETRDVTDRLKGKLLARKIKTFIHFRRVFFRLPTRVRVLQKNSQLNFFSR